MRGSDSRTGQLFSYVDLEARVRRHAQLRAIRGIVNDALSALAEDFAALYSPIGAILGPAGEALEDDAFAGILLDPLGTAADGAAGI